MTITSGTIREPVAGEGFKSDLAIAPGEILLDEFLRPLGLTQRALALAIGVPPIRISEILHAKRAITPDTALRFSAFFGTTPEFWMNLQSSYDLTLVRLANRSRYSQIKPLTLTA